MIRRTAAALLCLMPWLAAQETLKALQARFDAEAAKLEAPTEQQIQELLARQVAALEQFLDKNAKGDDAAHGRVLLAELQLGRRDRAAAAAALKKLDVKAAPAAALVSAAGLAGHLELGAERTAFVEAAVGKAAAPAERLQLARRLVRDLQEHDRAEAIFSKALAAAADDEQRALVRWHQAESLRDREDVPENAAFDALEKLANDLPATYWGSVAKDRLRATRLQRGDDAIPFRAKTRDGREVVLRDHVGKAVVLAFWSANDRDTKTLVASLADAQKAHGDKLVVLGVNLDEDAAAVEAAVRELGITFPVVADGKGSQNDIALRWFVEAPVVQVVDTRGKVVGLGLHAGTADARAELAEVIARAVK